MSIDYVYRMILIDKQDFILVGNAPVNSKNVIIDSNCIATNFIFHRGTCNYYSTVQDSNFGQLYENSVSFSCAFVYQDVVDFFQKNAQKEFVAFLKTRNNIYILGNDIGLDLDYFVSSNQMKVDYFLKNKTGNQVIESDDDIDSFFIGRDFGNDFYIDFG